MTDPTPSDSLREGMLAKLQEVLATNTSVQIEKNLLDDLDPETRSRLEGNHLALNLFRNFAHSFGFSKVSNSFGRFVIVRKLGAGGCGVVYLADDTLLDRSVALKVPRLEAVSHPDLRDRFLREARAAALLSHPNLVPVHETGSVGGIDYIVSEYCPGQTLAESLAKQLQPMPAFEAARLLEEIANGIGYAHRRGVVHRDLKPSNVLLHRVVAPGKAADALGDIVPKVTDFGFAKLLESNEERTRTGVLIGTPNYMAPEQAQGEQRAVGPTADVWALGVVLYEMLTNRLPIRGASDLDTLRRIVSDEPDRPRKLNPSIPRDLEAVCLRCLHKDPARRYPDGDALAVDLGRFLAGLPTQARPVRWPEAAVKWAQRNPWAVSLIVVVVGAMVLIGTLIREYQSNLEERNTALSESLAREKERTEEAQRERARADERALEARRQAYLARMRTAASLARSGRLTNTAVETWDPAEGPDVRGFEWYHLAWLGQSHRVITGQSDWARRINFSADGTKVLTYFYDDIRLWNIASGSVLHQWAFQKEVPLPLYAMSPNGSEVIIGDYQAKARYYKIGESDPWEIPWGTTYVCGFMDAGRKIYGLSHDQCLTIWDHSARIKLHEYKARYLYPSHYSSGAVVTPDGSLALLWQSQSPEPFHRYQFLDPSNGHLRSSWISPSSIDLLEERVAISQDNTHFAQAWYSKRASDNTSPTGGISWWKIGGQLKAETKLEQVLTLQSHSINDGRLAVAVIGGQTNSKVMLFWYDPSKNRVTATDLDVGCAVATAAIHPEAKQLVLGALDKTLRVVDLDPRPWTQASSVHSPAEVWALAVSPDGRTIVTGGDDHAVRLWSAGGPPVRRAELVGHEALVTRAVFSPSGEWFATGSFDETVRIWDAKSFICRYVLKNGKKVRALALSPDGSQLAVAGDEGSISTWDPTTGRSLAKWNTGANLRVHAIAYSPDGESVFAPIDSKHFGCWDAVSGISTQDFVGSRTQGLAVSAVLNSI